MNFGETILVSAVQSSYNAGVFKVVADLFESFKPNAIAKGLTEDVPPLEYVKAVFSTDGYKAVLERLNKVLHGENLTVTTTT